MINSTSGVWACYQMSRVKCFRQRRQVFLLGSDRKPRAPSLSVGCSGVRRSNERRHIKTCLLYGGLVWGVWGLTLMKTYSMCCRFPEKLCAFTRRAIKAARRPLSARLQVCVATCDSLWVRLWRRSSRPAVEALLSTAPSSLALSLPPRVARTLAQRLIDTGLMLETPLVSAIIPNVSCVNDQRFCVSSHIIWVIAPWQPYLFWCSFQRTDSLTCDRFNVAITVRLQKHAPHVLLTSKWMHYRNDIRHFILHIVAQLQTTVALISKHPMKILQTFGCFFSCFAFFTQSVKKIDFLQIDTQSICAHVF